MAVTNKPVSPDEVACDGVGTAGGFPGTGPAPMCKGRRAHTGAVSRGPGRVDAENSRFSVRLMPATNMPETEGLMFMVLVVGVSCPRVQSFTRSCGQPSRVVTDSRGHPPTGSVPDAVIPPLATNPRGLHPPMGSLTCEVTCSPVHPLHTVTRPLGHPLTGSATHMVTHPTVSNSN